ncbi:UDP-glucose 4-epimerase GalE [bacterium]|nr:UDP-glucose 4-epimerase GalE [bacterium]
MKNILITGGAGYIGSATVDILLRYGYAITVVDNLFRGFLSGIHEKTHFHSVDLLQKNILEQAFKTNKFDAVIHLAALAYVKESTENPKMYLDNNIQSTQNIIELCKKYEVGKLIFSSSCTIFGNENGDSPVKEESRIKPINPYGESKVICENLIKESGLDYIILRYFNVAGANPEKQLGIKTSFASHLVHALSRAVITDIDVSINGNGSYVRDYIHVDDVAGIHLKALQYIEQQKCREIINCGYGEGYTVLDIVNKFEQVNSVKIRIKKAEFRVGDPQYLVCDNTKLKKIFSWRSSFSKPLEHICKSSLEWEKLR